MFYSPWLCYAWMTVFAVRNVCACTCVGAICMKSMSAHFTQPFNQTPNAVWQHTNTPHDILHHLIITVTPHHLLFRGSPLPRPINLHFSPHTQSFPFSFIGTELFPLWFPRPSQMMVVYEPSSEAQELAGTFPSGDLVPFLSNMVSSPPYVSTTKSTILLVCPPFSHFLWAVAYCQQFFNVPVTGSHLVTMR